MVILDLRYDLRKTQSGRSHDYREVMVFVFGKLCFLEGLAWTVCLTVEIKSPFPGVVWRVILAVRNMTKEAWEALF